MQLPRYPRSSRVGGRWSLRSKAAGRAPGAIIDKVTILKGAPQIAETLTAKIGMEALGTLGTQIVNNSRQITAPPPTPCLTTSSP